MAGRINARAWVQIHVAELFLLPIMAGCAATSWSVMLHLAIFGKVTTTHVLGLVLLSILTIYTAILIDAFGLPVALHLAGTVFVVGLAYILPEGVVTLLAGLLTWLVSLLLGSVCAAAIPTERLLSQNLAVAERIDRLRMEKEVYAQQRAAWAARAALGRSWVLIASAMGAWLLSQAFQVELTDLNGAAYFVAASAGLLFSLVVFTAMMRLFSQKRLWQGDETLHIQRDLGTAWPRIILLLLSAVLLSAILLPHNLSPLHAVDWNVVMDDFTVSVFNKVRPQMESGQPGAGHIGPAPTSVSAARGGDGFELFPLLYALVAVGIFSWVLLKLLRHLLNLEWNRGRGLFRILMALTGFALPLLNILWNALRGSLRPRRKAQRRSEVKVETPESPIVGEDTNHTQVSQTAITVRRIFILLLMWAKEQGSRRRQEQTAKEFAHTLQHRFPSIAQEIMYVAETYQWSRYSHRPVESSILDRVRLYYQRIIRTVK